MHAYFDILLMKFKAACSFLFGDILAPNCHDSSVPCFLADLIRLNNFVAFIFTGYLLSTRMIRNRMCPELRILVNFLLD